MNKQEIIEKLEKSLTYCAADYDSGYDDGIGYAIDFVKQLDEPEKPVLTKAEAEWVDNLTEFFDTPDALYYITRCGYSEYPFTFDFWGDTYELPIEEGIEYGELNKIRERLVKAVVYGYEVEKEKLYTVEIPNPNSKGTNKIYLCKNDTTGKVYLCKGNFNPSKNRNLRLTESEIKKDFDWAWQFAEEVE